MSAIKLTIERAALLDALTYAQGVVERRNTIPILSNVVLDASGDDLRLTSTDLDLTITLKVKAQIAVEGSITAPAHMLFDIVRRLPDSCQIALSVDKGKLVVAGGRSRFTLHTLPATDFPSSSVGEAKCSFELAAVLGRIMVDKVRHAILNDPVRYFLNGIFMHRGDGGGIVVAATDGHRLARHRVPEVAAPDDLPDVILPTKFVTHFRKLIDASEAMLSVSVAAQKIAVSGDNWTLTSKLIDGTYPDYNRVIPQTNDLELRIDPKMVSTAVERVAAVCSEKTRCIKWTLTDDLLTLSATSAENGSATEDVPCVYSGKPIEVGFNGQYLIEQMRVMAGEAEIRLLDGSGPVLINDLSSAASTFILMPMRVN